VTQLITNGEVVHGYIGVSMFQLGIDELSAYAGLSNDELEDEYGFPTNGAIVSEITPGGPADRAGIQGGGTVQIGSISVPVGDVITEIEDEPVSSSDDVIEVVNYAKPGDELGMTVLTPGENERHVEVTVGTRPEGV
jgi:S1-C subfamily serine protease